MDTDESEQIILEKLNIKERKRKNNWEILIKLEINENNKISCFVLKLLILIIIILIISISQLLLLYRDKDNHEKRNEKGILNEDNNINIFNKEKNPENTSINITEEIENFVKSRRKITSKEISDYRLLNSENLLSDNIKYKKSEFPDVSIIITMSNQAHCIHKALRSVQNQSLKNIEIIISVDCSIIKKYRNNNFC